MSAPKGKQMGLKMIPSKKGPGSGKLRPINGKESTKKTAATEKNNPAKFQMTKSKASEIIGVRDPHIEYIYNFQVMKPIPPIKPFVERFDDMLEGELADLPPKPPSEVRIFLSSTFSDMREERNWLIKTTYPRLKEYCNSELDLDFQVVDMRWGVTDDATNDHDTERLCLQEIANCQRLSLGPSFVTLLGQRYGFRPIPTELSIEHFDAICKEAAELRLETIDLLKEWYCLDENSVPAEYVLQPIRTHLPNFGNYAEGGETARKKDTAEWWKIFESLQNTIRKCAAQALAKGALNKDMQHNTVKSVTEFEIKNGLLDANEPTSHTMCFMRDFEGLDNSTITEDHAARCIDTVTDDVGMKEIDKEVAELRTKVRENIRKKLPMTHIRAYHVPWTAGGVKPNKSPEHEKYLRSFSNDFESGIKMLIDKARTTRDNLIPVSEYYSELDETLHHLHFTTEKCKNFRGQMDILNQAKAYLKNPKCRKPLVIYAESGVGKTSVMAMIMKNLPRWFGKNCTRMIRYLGTSPQSSDIYSVLYSIMGQLADVNDQILEPEGTQSIKSMVSYLPRFLRNIGRKTKEHIFILLDSLDQLSPAYGAHDLKWLPIEYPPNVHIIVSTLPKTNNCLDNARKVINNPGSFHELKPIPESTGQKIIDSYLQSKNRTITKAQNKLILARLEKSPSPLFLKLLLDRSLSWHSYTPVDDITLHDTVRETINQQFKTLETKFGSKFIRAALGYLTVGRNGLTEIELEDVLSCNDEVLDEVYQYHSPPLDGIIRIPGLLWARVRNDISEYLADRQSDGRKTFYWYHRQFIEAAQEMYVVGDRQKQLHRELADLFSAENGVKKTITLSKRKMTITDADRQVTPQPLVTRNKRKLNALPYHVLKTADINLAKTQVLLNIRFLSTLIHASGMRSVLSYFYEAVEIFKDDDEIQLLLSCLRDMKLTITPEALAGELLARVPERKNLPHVSRLLSDALSLAESSKNASLIPMYACLYDAQTPSNDNSGNTLDTLRTATSLKFSFVSPNTLISIEEDGTLKLWDLTTKTSMKRIKLEKEVTQIDQMVQLAGGMHLAILCKKNQVFTVLDIESGNQVSPIPDKVMSICEGDNKNEMFIASVDSKNKTTVSLVEYEAPDFGTNKTIMSHPIKENIATPGEIEMCLSSSKKYVLLKVHCTEKEKEIILKSEKRNNLRESTGMYKFLALELKTGTVSQCFKILTNILNLGNCWCPYQANDWLIIGRERFTVIWDLNNSKCDQKISKEQIIGKTTKIAMFYRPEWIEDTSKKGHDTICWGRTLCIARGRSSKSPYAIGSEDGFLLVFDGETGLSVAGHIGTKPNHGNTPVVMCAVCDDNKWVVSVGQDNSIVLWSLEEKCKKAFKMTLNATIKSVEFSPCSNFVCVLGQKKDGSTRPIIFRVNAANK